jgi:hypothetical protein
VGDAEALLLVDDHEAEVLERYARNGERVRADDDANAAVRQACLDGARLGRFRQTGEVANFDAEPGETPPEGLQVLAHKHGGWRHDGDLLAGESGRRSSAERHLGLAEADIAAHEAVHRPLRGEVVEHVRDGAELVGRLGKGKAGDEALVVAGRRHELRCGLRLALARQRDEPLRRLGDLRLDLGAALRPGLAVEAVQADRIAGSVAPYAVEFLDGRHKRLVVGVAEPDGVHGSRGVCLDRLEPLEEAHAAVEMDHRVANAKLAVACHQLGGTVRLAAVAGATADHVHGRDDRHGRVRVDEAAVEVGVERQHGSGLRGLDGRPVGSGFGFDAGGLLGAAR